MLSRPADQGWVKERRRPPYRRPPPLAVSPTGGCPPLAAARHRRPPPNWQSASTCKVYLAGANIPSMLTVVTGDELLKVLATLANPHRLRVVAELSAERNYVSALARDLGISRALLQVHLRKLESAGLVRSSVEVSEDGKAMKFYEVAPFAVSLTPEVIAAAARTLSVDGGGTDTGIARGDRTDQDMEAKLR
jgi:DNA-binding transcriptional ArsR family regulator